MSGYLIEGPLFAKRRPISVKELQVFRRRINTPLPDPKEPGLLFELAGEMATQGGLASGRGWQNIQLTVRPRTSRRMPAAQGKIASGQPLYALRCRYEPHV